ncbi:hypothetical protein BC832DRAFT_618467 [Gaertneriomyces semiglobifer]|nr:hypothetical protein BC832DRAFT_618467 [Gaertneriomyces semiglobifer]
MKKAGSTSKDRLSVKSGNPKKRSPSTSGIHPAGGAPANVGAGPNGSDDSQDAPVVIWPEWSDAEIATEKWAVKHVFEDPEGVVSLPKSLRSSVEGYKRALELIQDGQSPVCVQPLHLLDVMFHSGSAEGREDGPVMSRSVSRSSALDGYAAGGTANVPEAVLEQPEDVENEDKSKAKGDADGVAGDEQTVASDTSATSTTTAEATRSAQTAESGAKEEEPIPTMAMGVPPNVDESTEGPTLSTTSRFFQHNRHLLGSELMRNILATFHFLYDQARQPKPAAVPGTATDETSFLPWDPIFPKSKDGLPMYNTSGKYIVKLWWLGSWRKITVDDRIPVDADGRSLIVSSPTSNEIWPMILTKAILKIACLSYKEPSDYPEQGDVDIFHMLKGWLPERIPIPSFLSTAPLALWATLSSFSLRASTSAVNVAPPTQPASRAGKGAAPPVNLPMPTFGGKPNPIVILFANREASEDQSETATSVPVRILDIRESALFNSLPQSEDSEKAPATLRLVKIRSYWSCGYHRARKHEVKGNPKATEDISPPLGENALDLMDSWISFADFCRTFTSMTVYHSQSSFKTIKSIHNIPDPAKINETLRVPQVLYLPETDKPVNLLLVLSTYGRYEADGIPPNSFALLEEYDWRGPAVTAKKPDNGTRVQVSKALVRISTNGTMGAWVEIPAGEKAYCFAIHCPTTYHVSICSRSDFLFEDEAKYLTERLGLCVRDVDEPFGALSPGWGIFVKSVLGFTEPTFLSANLYTPEQISQTSCLRLFDNDTGTEIPQVFFTLLPRTYHPIKHGYTLVADYRATTPKPAGRWKLRLISDKPVLFPPPEKQIEIWTKPIVQDFEDICVPNKHNVLFRQVLKVKDAPFTVSSIQLTFSFANVWVKLQVFDYDVELYSGCGKGVATIYAVNLEQSEETPPAKEKEKEKEKEKDKEKEKEKSTESKDRKGRDTGIRKSVGGKEGSVSISPSAAEPVVLPKHRYIVQGSVERVDLIKLLASAMPAPTSSGGSINAATNAGEDVNRPSSRGVKAPPTASAKKKRSSATASSSTSVTTTATPAAVVEDKAPTTGNEPMWRLRIISTDTASLTVTRDTEKEDRHRAIKDAWEAAQPGRAAKAREAREAYLKQMEAGAVKPIVFTASGEPAHPGTNMAEEPVYKPWVIMGRAEAKRMGSSEALEDVRVGYDTAPLSEATSRVHLPNSSRSSPTAPGSRVGSANTQSRRTLTTTQGITITPHVLTPDELAQMEQDRLTLHSMHESFYKSLLEQRAKDREKRQVHKALYIQKFEDYQKRIDQWRTEDLARREAYRQKVIKDFEDAKEKARLAIEAARENAIAAEERALAEEGAALAASAGAQSDKDKSKKRAGAKR